MGSEPLTELERASDQELVGRACRGDDPAFEEIVRRYGKRVFQIASRFFRRRPDVEEIAQEVFLKVFSRLPTYKARGSLQGWIGRIAANTCLNALRDASRRPEVPAADLTEDETVWLESRLAGTAEEQRRASERSLLAADLAEKVLGRMSPEDRLVLLLVDGDEFSIKEVAQMTGWSESKVKIQAFRARRRMRRAIEVLLGEKHRNVDIMTDSKDDL